MKKTSILTLLTVIPALLIFSSCGPSRVYATKDHRPPPPSHARYAQPGVALIISPSPGFRMSQHPDGRFYHRSAQGFLYWKGYDNRFYLDRSYFSRITYSKWEYKEWKRYSKQSHKR